MSKTRIKSLRLIAGSFSGVLQSTVRLSRDFERLAAPLNVTKILITTIPELETPMNDVLKLSYIPNEIEVVVEAAHGKEDDVLVLPVNLAIVFLLTFDM